MKILVVIYYDGSAESVTRPLAKLSPLQAEMGFSADLYVYGEKDPDNFQIGNFEGRAYFQRFEVAAAEWVAEAVRALVARNQYYGVIAADQEQASALAVLMANKLDYDFVTGVVSMRKEKEGLLCERPVYNNNLSASYLLRHPFVLSEKLPKNAGGATSLQAGTPRNIVWDYLEKVPAPAWLLEKSLIEENLSRPESPVLLAVGMGVSKREDVNRIRDFAEKNGFDFGVSRPVAMRGWSGINDIIGVSGRILAPEITIAIGISGAAAFYAGIEQSGYILSINTDPDAAITERSDAVIADDYNNVLDGLFELLSDYKR